MHSMTMHSMMGMSQASAFVDTVQSNPSQQVVADDKVDSADEDSARFVYAVPATAAVVMAMVLSYRVSARRKKWRENGPQIRESSHSHVPRNASPRLPNGDMETIL